MPLCPACRNDPDDHSEEDFPEEGFKNMDEAAKRCDRCGRRLL